MRLSSTSFRLIPSCLILVILGACENATEKNTPNQPVASSKTIAKTTDGQFISWKEHLIDDPEIGGVLISGSDGLVMADLDLDGYEDIVSVHESDTKYDGVARGHIRIAFGSADPDQWELVTLAEGEEAGAAEDASIDDINGDGYPDIVAACELSHLVYFENPGAEIRTSKWKRLIPKITQNKGSYIRVFTADFNRDGRFEVIAPNKGSQNTQNLEDKLLNAISWFEIDGDPLLDESWTEHEIIKVLVPINSQPIDIDKDGDLDVIGGSRGEKRIVLLENVSKGAVEFRTHPIKVSGSAVSQEKREEDKGLNRGITGFNMEFIDLSGDGRLDIVLQETFRYLVWLEQPSDWEKEWSLHTIGTTHPDDLVGITAADINGDGNMDFMTGGYSGGSRDKDAEVTVNDKLGRLAWFEHPGDLSKPWIRHDISRRKRGMFDKFVARDLDKDGDMDFVSTRGNSHPYDGVFWLEQVRSVDAGASFVRVREKESEEMGLPEGE